LITTDGKFPFSIDGDILDYEYLKDQRNSIEISTNCLFLSME
jgi:hypothetical protein